MDALSPRDANAMRPARAESKAPAQPKAAKDKEHPPPPPNNVTEPSSIDRREGAVYQIGKLLGKGGFAICYEGKLAGTSKRYALKIVKCQMPSKMEQKFQTELQIHSKMRQQNIVQFHRAFTFESCTYLVLELCPNGSLMDLVKKRKGLTEPEVRFYSIQIAGAIKYMHAKGIIHRDLKMGNIFLDKHMNAKVGDFGLAALLLTGKDMQIMRRTTLCGTPNYIAPEILEKGKKGHDHQVDIWSLGIIVFAMLTSKPPFQSSTTDEIYRRARERDYEWPTETSSKQISLQAKDLVALMLEDADLRPDPDTIVEHAFFTSGYLPHASEMTAKLRDGPPEIPAFYQPLQNAQVVVNNTRNVRDMCRECGVGPWTNAQMVFKNIWREMAEEETHGLTPIIPLAEGIVYRPYEEVRNERRLQNRLEKQALQNRLEKQAQAPQARQTQQTSVVGKTEDRTTEVSGVPLQAVPRPLAKAPQSFSHQSHAATLRERGRPVASNGQSQAAAEGPSRPTGALRSRPTREVLSAEGAAGEQVLPSRPARARTQATASSKSQRQASGGSSGAVTGRPVMLTRKLATGERMSLFSPSESQEEVPGTTPDDVLARLQKLQTELERALNARTMAIVSAKDKTPPPPQIVVKWVDYTNKFGLGYILNDGSVGCVLRSIPTQDNGQEGYLPPACLLVRGAERHCLRRDDATYPDRHQMVPMTQDIYFYENIGEDGLRRVRVPPQSFSVDVSPEGMVGRLSSGKDIYDHRKRERMVLWKKFANYMIAHGREMDPSHMEESARVRRFVAEDEAPSDVVTFYQRFGDVGCWMFCDGHMQFNFPDHTKIVLNAAGTWCHFWHLRLEAARSLEATGMLGESALDDRTVLSYPLQTLLNFATTPSSSTANATSGTSSRRRRPEIAPELRDIPAANQFRRKIEFVRDVVREWTANGGLGNSDMARERRLRWTGMRETGRGAAGATAAPLAKHVWVTIGARAGDERLSAFVDPAKPAELGPDIDETKRDKAKGS